MERVQHGDHLLLLQVGVSNGGFGRPVDIGDCGNPRATHLGLCESFFRNTLSFSM